MLTLLTKIRNTTTSPSLPSYARAWLSVSMDAKQCMRVCYCPAADLHVSFAVISITSSFPPLKTCWLKCKTVLPQVPEGPQRLVPGTKNEQNLDKRLSCYSGNIKDIVDVFSWAIYIIFYSICESQSLDRQSGQRCILLHPCLGQQAINAEAI